MRCESQSGLAHAQSSITLGRTLCALSMAACQRPGLSTTLLGCRGPKIDEAYNKWEGTTPDDDRRSGRKQNWEYMIAEKARLQAERATLSAGGLRPRVDRICGLLPDVLTPSSYLLPDILTTPLPANCFPTP